MCCFMSHGQGEGQCVESPYCLAIIKQLQVAFLKKKLRAYQLASNLNFLTLFLLNSSFSKKN